jgi:hypothetical protein
MTFDVAVVAYSTSHPRNVTSTSRRPDLELDDTHTCLREARSTCEAASNTRLR